MNNDHESDAGHTPNGPMVIQYLQKVLRHIFRIQKLALGNAHTISTAV